MRLPVKMGVILALFMQRVLLLTHAECDEIRLTRLIYFFCLLEVKTLVLVASVRAAVEAMRVGSETPATMTPTPRGGDCEVRARRLKVERPALLVKTLRRVV
jgi:hypothetical protein